MKSTEIIAIFICFSILYDEKTILSLNKSIYYKIEVISIILACKISGASKMHLHATNIMVGIARSLWFVIYEEPK